MGFYLTIEAGDHLASVAAELDFPDPLRIWDARENEKLRAERTPDILQPGDQLYIPDRAPRTVQLATGARHKAVVSRGATKIRIGLRDPIGEPMPGGACILTVDGVAHPVTADGDGIVELAIPPDAAEALLEVGGQQFELRIGHLDPIATEAGILARLRNLGYLVDDPDAPIDDELVSLAVELFQVDHGLTVDGAAREAIADALLT